MATTKITTLKAKKVIVEHDLNVQNMTTLKLAPKRNIILKATNVDFQGQATYNGKEIATKEDITNILDKITVLEDKDVIIKDDIKELREDLNDIKDYDIDKPGTQDMDGDTTFYIADAEDITNAINNAQNGDEIKLQTTASVADTGSSMVIDGVNVILNLHNNTLVSGNGNDDTVRISNGTVTVKGNGSITTYDPYDSNHSTTILSANENGNLIIDGAAITAVMDDAVNKGQFGVGVFENGQITINDAEITTGWYCITGNGGKTNADSKVTINNGNLTSTVDYAIYHPDPGTLIINGGTITGGAGAISANNGNIIINGGTLKTTGDGDTGDWNDGTSGQTPAVINLNGKYGAVNCEINDGTFIAMNNAPIVITGTKYPVSISIKGGRFSQKPNAEWIADGYTVSDEPDEENFYVVYKA